MPRFQAGDEIEVNVNDIHHAYGSPGNIINDPQESPRWASAIVLQVYPNPAGEGYESYQIRITSGDLTDATGEVELETIRSPQSPP